MSELKKSLSLMNLIFYGVGTIIGAGIYSIIGAAAGEAGVELWQSFMLSALIATLTGLSYAELASAFPKAGAEYVYIRNAFPNLRSFAFATGFTLAIAAATTATTVSHAFAGYLSNFLDFPLWIGAATLLILCTGINVLGIQESSRINMLFTIIEIVGLGLVIYFGFSNEKPLQVSMTPHLGVLNASATIFFVYLGFNDLANLSEEAKNPEKDVPKAILISLLITSALYVAVAIALIALGKPEEFANSRAPLAQALRGEGEFWARSLSVIALFSTANTALINLIVSSRIVYRMTKDGDLPKVFSTVHGRRKTPWVAALLMFTVSLFFLPFGGVSTMGDLSSFASLVAFAAVNFCLLALRFQDPDKKHPFRVPINVGKIAIIPLLGILSVLVLMTQFEFKVLATGLLVLALGLGVYFFTRQKKLS